MTISTVLDVVTVIAIAVLLPAAGLVGFCLERWYLARHRLDANYGYTASTHTPRPRPVSIPAPAPVCDEPVRAVAPTIRPIESSAPAA
ncbi:hypothetical protein GS504_01430 [Rhodococcus hoagii]|nr:hypothetical protein [Prescottella equi]NKS71665.1 hypothetical protein [Prescottella equi]